MAQELSRLLDPESVAIIGVSENPSRIGGRLFKYLTKHGYKGHLALVNPKYRNSMEWRAIRPFLIYRFKSIVPLSRLQKNMSFRC